MNRLVPLALAVAISSALPLHAAAPADVFGEYCASCHGADGKARTPAGKKLKAKDLTESKLSDSEVINQITNGTKSERGAERMPAFKDKLSAADISALAEYVKTFRK